MRRIVPAAVGLMLMGCAPVSPTPTAQVTPDFVRPFHTEDGEHHLLVYDPAGLLADVQQQDQGTIFDPDIRWDPILDSPDSFFLQWMGGACTTDRTLTVGKQGSQVSLDVFEGPNRPLASAEACPAVGIIYRLRLTFRQPITDLDIAVGLTELPQ